MGTKPEDAGMVVVPPIIVFVEVAVLGGDGGAVTVEATCSSGQNCNGDGRSSQFRSYSMYAVRVVIVVLVVVEPLPKPSRWKL